MTDLDFKTIGSKIRERRKSMGITQEQVADFLGINPSHVSNVENGRANPSLTALINIANILECSIDQFVYGEYTFNRADTESALDKEIMDKIKYCDYNKKTRISQMIDLL